jgi:integrase
MARRRGRQRGRLVKGNVSWFGYWWVWEPNPRTGQMEWQRRSKAVCPVVKVNEQGKRVKVTETEARQHFNEQVLDQLETVNVPDQTSSTVKDYWIARFEPAVKRRLRRRGIMHYQGLFNTHILKTEVRTPTVRKFGDLPVRYVTRDHVQQLIDKRREAGYAGQTLLHIRHVLTTFFKEAKLDKWYAGDLPTEGVEVGQITKKRPTNAVTWEQAKGLVEMLKEPYRTMVLTMVLTGLRVGEACGLRWKRVNLTAEWTVVDGEALRPYTMAVRENYGFAKDPVGGKGKGWSWRYGPLKAEGSRRNIPLPATVVTALTAWKEKTKFGGPEDPVFANGAGKPIDQNTSLARVLKPAGVELGLISGVDKKGKPKSWLSWHCFRRTANTLAGAEGMSVGGRKRVFGWTDDQMVMHYDRTDTEDARDVMERMANRLMSASSSELNTMTQ